MNEKTTLSEAVDELFESGPETLARAIEEEEARLPILGELRREIEGSGYGERLRWNAARFLAFVETRPRDPETPRKFHPPRLPCDPRRPRALPPEEQIHLLYLSIWRQDRLPAVDRPFPWARTPLERAWARLHGHDLACLGDVHYWLAEGRRALEVSLGLLRLAVEEAMMMAPDVVPEDYSHLDRLVDLFLEDPILDSDETLAPALHALSARVTYYRWLHQHQANTADLLALARDLSNLDLSGDPYLQAQLRLRVLREEKGCESGEEARRLRQRLDELVAGHEKSPGRAGPGDLELRPGPMEHALRRLDRQVGAARGRAVALLDDALREERPDSLLPAARQWLWEEWSLPEDAGARARKLLAEVAVGSVEWGMVADAFHAYALTRLPTAPLECFHRLRIALRLCGPHTATKTGVVCDLLVVAWLFGLPLAYRDDLDVEPEQPGDLPEGRIIAALCPALGLHPVRLLPRELLGVRRLLRSTLERKPNFPLGGPRGLG